MDKSCPRCHGGFQCANPFPGCWCTRVTLSREVLGMLRENYDDCLCPSCLKEYSETGFHESWTVIRTSTYGMPSVTEFSRIAGMWRDFRVSSQGESCWWRTIAELGCLLFYSFTGKRFHRIPAIACLHHRLCSVRICLDNWQTMPVEIKPFIRMKIIPEMVIRPLFFQDPSEKHLPQI